MSHSGAVGGTKSKTRLGQDTGVVGTVDDGFGDIDGVTGRLL